MGMGPDPVLIISMIQTQVSNSGRMTLSKVRAGFAKVDKAAEYMTHSQFAEALGFGGLFLKTQDISTLSGVFRSEQDPTKVDVARFFAALRGEMPPDRRAAVEVAWASVDSSRKGTVPLERIMECFQAAEHPRVQTREMTCEEVRAQLEHDLRDLGAANNCSKEVFMEYFGELSACIPTEKQFIFDALVNRAFLPPNPMAVPVDRLEQLTRFLCEKFQQISPKEDIYRCVRGRFHHHDKGATGGLGVEEFSALLVSIGMNLPAHEREAFFEFLAAPCGGGRIELDVFSGMMRKISETPPMQFESADTAAAGGEKSKSPTALVQKIKAHLLRYHPNGLTPLFVAFRQLDKQERGFVTHSEFVFGLRQCGLRLGTQELENLVGFFDSNRDGRVTYGVFLDQVRGYVPKERVELIEAAWAKVSSWDEADAEGLLVRYNPSQHPGVLGRKITVEQKCKDFRDYLGESMSLGKVSKTAFCAYFVDEGLSIEAPDAFETYVSNSL